MASLLLITKSDLKKKIKEARRSDIIVCICMRCGEEHYNLPSSQKNGECLYCGSYTVDGPDNF